ncbi:MAG TPA: right-handed parallel beta-helix repeat-containing protein [Terriglobales bacterium]
MKSLATICVLAFLCAGACAATYYVDTAGSNGNDGLSPQTPWRTLLKVGISTFQPGDVVLFKRDCVWNEWLTPPSNGTAGNLIKFDAYGTGQPPEFTGRYVTSSSQWTNTTGNVWQITLSAAQAISQLKFVQFGTIWGNVQISQAALAHNRDWYYDNLNQILYAYSSTGNPITSYGAVTPIILSGQTLINVNAVSYIEIQHLKLDFYDGYGVQVQGASDHVWLANIIADSQVPNATVPIGFYVHPNGTPGDIHIYNTDAHRNYVGYRFDGSASAIDLTNCRAYANRTYGLTDNTGAVTYSYCHFYANNLATGISTDVTGHPVNGGNNIAADTPPNVRGFTRYPARITVTYDDPGLIDGSHQYIQALLPTFQQKSVPLSIAVVTGYPLSQQLVSTFQSWINSGFDLNSHSVSHQYFVYPNAFTLQYTGTAATTVTLSIANKQLTITAPDDPSAQVTWDLSTSGTNIVPSGLDTLGGIIFTLNQRGVFSVTADPNMKSAVKSGDLADIVAQDIKTAPFRLQMNKTRLMTDELNWAMAWMSANLTGLPANRVYVYPGSFEDTSTEAIAVAANYAGSRGSGTMQPSPNAATVLGTGINVQNILSQGIAPQFQNLNDSQFANKLRALVFKSATWGVPFGIFWHVNELSGHQVGIMLDTLKSSGATLMTNTQLVNHLLSTQQDVGTTLYADSTSASGIDARPTAASPVVDAGAPLSSEYKFDLLGIDQSLFGTAWEIGAFAFVPDTPGRLK